MAKTTPQQKQRLRKALGGAAAVRKRIKKSGGFKKPNPNQAKAQTRILKRKVKKMLGKSKNPAQKAAIRRKAARKK